MSWAEFTFQVNQRAGGGGNGGDLDLVGADVNPGTRDAREAGAALFGGEARSGSGGVAAGVDGRTAGLRRRRLGRSAVAG